MPFLHNISTVARYEAKTLRRSWFFRLFSLGALVIFTFMNIGLFSPIGNESWDLVSLPSSVPLINLYLLNIAQAIVIIFLASDFLKRDKKLDTNEVLYTRSMSNLEYVTGKTWGILRLFLGLNILILSIGLFMNIISKTMSIDIISYISYLLLISVPTIVFSLGLAYLIMSVIRNQAITFLILLGLAALNVFYLWFRMGSIFDYMAFGLPLFKSGIIGFDNLPFIVNQRLLFLFLGLAFMLITVLIFKRLPQSRFHKIITILFLIVSLTAAGFCGFNTYSSYARSFGDKILVIETNKKYENQNFATLTDANIELIHKGKTIEAIADLKILNDNNEPLPIYILSLNPSLEVQKITSGGKDLKFKRINHIIEIDPGKILLPEESDSLIITYKGSINESFCYPNYNDNPKDNPYRIAMLNVNKRQAFLNEDYLLLTPETHWYPATSLNFYPSNPARIKVDFTNFRLKVKTRDGLTAVSQGTMKADNGYFHFNSESPLTGLTLLAGDYRSDTLVVDEIKYISYHFPENDYYKKDLAELKDTLPDLISGIMRDLETNFSVKYPFKTLSMVEVPLQFYSYPKKSSQTRAELQPSMVLLPEKLSTLQNAGFNKQFTRQKKRMARNNTVVTDKELQVRLFNSFIRNTFISGENFRFVNGSPTNEPTRYRLGPSFYFFKNNFYSTEYPVINAVFESHLQKVNVPGRFAGFRGMSGNLSDNDQANLILREISFKDLLEANPSNDTMRTVLTVKGDYLFNLIRSKSGISEFKDWFGDYIEKNSFKRIDILKFNNDIKERFGFEIYPYLENWFKGLDQPGFIFSDLKAEEVIVGNRSRFQISFIAYNPEPEGGLFNISFRTGGQGGRTGGQGPMNFGGGSGGRQMGISMQGRGMESDDISKIIYLEPDEARKIGIVLDAQPRSMMINTLFAKNLPGEITMPISEITKTKGYNKEFNGEEILSSVPLFSDPLEIIVDNEDPGFISGLRTSASPLKKILGIENRNVYTYTGISLINIPEFWQPAVQSAFYGKYIHSAVYTRGGTGDRSVTWVTPIKDAGYYEVYCFIGKSSDRMTVRFQGGPGGAGGPGSPGGQGGRQQEESPYKEMHYKIIHDEGIEEITIDYNNSEEGWNNLGRYYLSPDSAKVVLTNLSQGKIVTGDAIKWVKQN